MPDSGTRLARSSALHERLYYVAIRGGDCPSAVVALEFVGYSREQAQWLVDNARANESEVVIAELSDGKGVAVTPLDDGRVTHWQAIIDSATPDREVALARVRELAGDLVDGVDYGIVMWTAPRSDWCPGINHFRSPSAVLH